MSENRQEKKKRYIWKALFALFNIAVIATTAFNEFSGNKSGMTEIGLVKNAPFFLGCTTVCLIILLIAESLKYCLMMRSLGEKPSFRIAFETASLGKYYDSITPSGAGGQPFQILWLHKHGYSDGNSSAMTITGYITMQTGFILLALSTFILARSVELEAIRFTAYLGLLFFSLVPALMILFSYKPKMVKRLIAGIIRLGAKIRVIKKPEESTQQFVRKLDSYHTSFKGLSRDKKVLSLLLFLSLLYRFALCSMPYFVLKMFGASVSFFHIFALTIYIYAAITLVPTPGNSGAAEGAFYLVFSAMGSNGVFWAMLIWRFFCYYSFIAVGVGIYAVNAVHNLRLKKWNRLSTTD